MIITVKKGKTGHHFVNPIREYVYPTTSKEEYRGKTSYSLSSYCNSAGSYYLLDKNKLPTTKLWLDEKICHACALQAYKKGEISITKNIPS